MAGVTAYISFQLRFQCTLLHKKKHSIYKIYVLKVAIGLNHVNCRINAQELHSSVDF